MGGISLLLLRCKIWRPLSAKIDIGGSGICFRCSAGWYAPVGGWDGLAGRERMEKERRGVNGHDELSYTTVTQ